MKCGVKEEERNESDVSILIEEVGSCGGQSREKNHWDLFCSMWKIRNLQAYLI